jgi:ribonuclease E
MTTKILINAVYGDECRIAKVKNSKLEEFNIETAAREITQGNIYKGVITRIEPGLQSVFVDYGMDKNGFLQKQEIHSDYFQENQSGNDNIKNIVRRGQELFVQVTKEPVLTKGALLTTYISIPGRYMVLMPGSKNQGISRKIEDEKERKRLKDILNSLNIPEEYGVIIRTAGVNCSKTMLNKDLKYLLRLWKNITKNGMEAKAPALLYKERNLALRSIRDHFTPDVTGILVDNETVYHEIKDFMKIVSPTHTKLIKLIKDEKPIFSKYQLEDQITSIYENRVGLKSGGSIVIEQTEALVTIDVNSGKATFKKKSMEETAYQTNLEAAEEIGRQLRLRDLGGLIVIDFIDMKDAKHKSEVVKSLKSHVKEDKARTTVGKISKFGLLEMSRQRIRPSIEFGSFLPCKWCKGKGLMPSVETIGLGFIRKLQTESLKEGLASITGTVSPYVADFLLNRKRKELLELEMKRDIRIVIESDPNMNPVDIDITCN